MMKTVRGNGSSFMRCFGVHPRPLAVVETNAFSGQPIHAWSRAQAPDASGPPLFILDTRAVRRLGAALHALPPSFFELCQVPMAEHHVREAQCAGGKVLPERSAPSI